MRNRKKISLILLITFIFSVSMVLTTEINIFSFIDSKNNLPLPAVFDRVKYE